VLSVVAGENEVAAVVRSSLGYDWQEPTLVARVRDGAWEWLNDGVHGGAQAMAVFENRLHAFGPLSLYQQGVKEGVMLRLEAGRWVPLATPMSGAIYAACSHNGALFVGGGFTANATNPFSWIARWDGTSWQHAGTLPGAVYCLREFQGQLYAGTVRGAGLYRFNGSDWVAVTGGPTGTSPGVYYMTEFDGKLVISGYWTSIAGVASTARLATFNGTVWAPVSGASTTDSPPLVVGFGGQLYAAYSQSLRVFNGTTWRNRATLDFSRSFTSLVAGGGGVVIGDSANNMFQVGANNLIAYETWAHESLQPVIEFENDLYGVGRTLDPSGSSVTIAGKFRPPEVPQRLSVDVAACLGRDVVLEERQDLRPRATYRWPVEARCRCRRRPRPRLGFPPIRR
jgi:hypothetical protein